MVGDPLSRSARQGAKVLEYVLKRLLRVAPRVAEKYHHPLLVPNPIDTFYSELFSNGIPRERTFETWMNTTGAVSWANTFAMPLADAMDRYLARLRSDFKGAIEGEAGRVAAVRRWSDFLPLWSKTGNNGD